MSVCSAEPGQRPVSGELYSAPFEAEPPFLSSDSLSERKRGEEADTTVHHYQIVSFRLATDPFFNQRPTGTDSDTVAHVAGITGRSRPAPEWWGRRPRRSFGTGEQ